MSHPTTAIAPRLRRWGPAIVVAALTAAAFAGSLAGTFLWDDEQFIVKNAYLTSPTLLPRVFTENIVAGGGLQSNLYRPVQSLTHAADRRLWGLRPRGHHLTNVLLHVALAVALWLMLRGLFGPWPSALAALWFALHPMQAEAVAYTSGRGDTIAMLALCLGLAAFERHPILALACATLGIGSKESLALFPVLLLLYEWARGRPIRPLRHLPFWILSGAYVLARLTVLNFQNTLNFYNTTNILTRQPIARLWTYATTIPKALQLWLWPADLHHERAWMVYPRLDTWPVLLSVALIAALVLLGWSLRRRARPIAAGIAWFFAATLPTSNLIVLINALFYDHWFLLPGLGLTLILGQLLQWAWPRPRARQAAIVAAVGVLGAGAAVTQHHLAVWRTPASLYAHILRYEPNSAKITNNLAMAVADAGDLPAAVALYRHAIALGDEYAQTHHNLANAYLHLGLEEQAAAELHRAVELDPAFHHSWISLAALYWKHGRLEEAQRALQQALRVHPFDASAYEGLAFVALRRGDRDAAERAIADGLAHLPNHPELLDAQRKLRLMRDSDLTAH